MYAAGTKLSVPHPTEGKPYGTMTFEVIELAEGDFHRILTSDVLPALSSVVGWGEDVTVKRRRTEGKATYYAHTGGEAEEGYGDTPEEALRYLLAAALTSWDQYEGFEDY